MNDLKGGDRSPMSSKNVACGSGDADCISGESILTCRFACEDDILV